MAGHLWLPRAHRDFFAPLALKRKVVNNWIGRKIYTWITRLEGLLLKICIHACTSDQLNLGESHPY